MERHHRQRLQHVSDSALSHSGPSALGEAAEDTASVVSFTSSVHSVRADARGAANREGGPNNEVDVRDPDSWSRRVEAMASTPENCDLMRANGTLDAAVRLLHENTVRRK